MNQKSKISDHKKKVLTSNDLILLCLAGMGALFLLIFAYFPMFGLILAFKDGDYALNLLDVMLYGDWTLFGNFSAIFNDPSFLDTFVNTLLLNLLMLVINFPAPIIFALLINEVRHRKYKTAVQTLTNFPHFISWAIFGGLIIAMTDMTTGVINPILESIGLSDPETPVNLQTAPYFYATIILASLIKNIGWGSIIYVAAISGIDSSYYEAAELDGASRFQAMLYITLPSIAPTITVFLLLNISGLLNNSFDQFYIFQNDLNISRSEVLTTYIYKEGMVRGKYGSASALGLLNSVISVILLYVSDFISKKTTGRGIY